MPLFICEKCGCVENTALGHYWGKDAKCIEGTEWDKALCSECAPDKFLGGTNYNKGGKWHGRFKKMSLQEYLNNGGQKSDLINFEIAMQDTELLKKTIVEVMRAYNDVINNELIIVNGQITLRPDHKSIARDYIIPRLEKIGIKITLNE